VELVAIAVGVFVAITAARLLINPGQRKREREVLEAALVASGVTVEWEEVLAGYSYRLRGLVGPQGLKVGLSSNRKGYRMVVDGLLVVRPLGLAAEDARSARRRAVGGGDVETGDAAFDDAVLVEGPAALALARLDAETRARALDVFGPNPRLEGAALSNGRLFTQVVEEATSREGLQAAFTAVVALAQRLHAPRKLAEALSDNVSRDPEPGVRLASLRALIREFPGQWVTRDACQRACCDTDERVALAGALQLGEGGHDTLLRLAQEAGDDETAVAAIEALGRALPAALLLQIFKRSREKGRTRKTVACVAVLARRPDAAEVPEVVKLLTDDLASYEEGLPEAAARALGRLGSIDAVLPLQEAAAAVGGSLRSAARQAVAEIQSRARGATPGQVSLATGEAGHVSLAEDVSGRMSVPEE